MKHTPGPWKIGQESTELMHPDVISPGSRFHAIDAKAHGALAIVVTRMEDGGGSSDEMLMANAQLIAAAPELLTALQAILPFCAKTSASEGGASKYSASVAAADLVRAAIDKATGVTS